MSGPLLRRKNALFWFFVILGVVLSSWVTRTPAIRDAIGASIAQMGMVLAGLSLGAMAGVLLSGRFIAWRGTRFTMLMGLTLVCLSLAVMALGVWLGSQVVVGTGLCLFGFGVGSADIAANLDAAAVEQQLAQPIMHTLHGCFSLGTLVGALLGLGANVLELPVATHLLLVLGVAVLVVLTHAKAVPAGYGRKLRNAQGEAHETAVPAEAVWRNPRVLAIGCMVFAVALAEGAAYDWLPILLVDAHGFSPSLGAMVFVIFTAVMTVGRFTGGWLLHRLGRAALVRLSLVLAAFGLACMALGQSQWLAALAVVCWGVGASLGFPMALSAAAEGGGASDDRVRAVATLGYVALLVGPPALGFIGQALGLRGAMLVVMACVLLSLLTTPALRAPQTPAQR
jgi:predicted MFS family arabinose efflux permease